MEATRRFTPGRVAAIAGALALTPLCVVSANDRIAGTDLPFAGLGSLDVGPNAKLVSAWAALGKSSTDADHLALAALASDPLNQTALNILAQGAEKRGDAVRTDAVYRVGAGLGWRDPATQRYWFEAAIGNHQYDVAAQHLDAMFRIGAVTSASNGEFGELEQTAAGRDAWVRQMQLAPTWIGPYVAGSVTVTGQQWPARLATLELARKRGVNLPQDMLGYLSSELLHAGDITQAYQIWTVFGGGVLPPAGSPLVANGDFQRPISAASTMPFEWRVASNSAAIAAAPTGLTGISGQALRVQLDSAPDNPIASLSLALKPGAYEIGWNVSATGDGENSQVVPRLQCGGSHATIDAKTAGDGTAQNPRFVFAVPPGNDCLFQSLAINALPEAMEARTIWIDNITVAPATAASATASVATTPDVTAPPLLPLRALRPRVYGKRHFGVH